MVTKHATETKTESWQGNIQDYKENVDKEETSILVTVSPTHNIEAPIFIMFAEYLGYVSQFQTVAENWCDGKIPEPHIQKFLMVEAACMLKQMKKDFKVEEITKYYDLYYPIILSEYVEKLRKISQ